MRQTSYIRDIHSASMEGAYDNLFGLGNKKKQAERREARQQRKIEKAAVKGAKERAKLGLDGDIPTPQGEAPKSNLILYAGIGAALLVIVVVIFIIKRK